MSGPRPGDRVHVEYDGIWRDFRTVSVDVGYHYLPLNATVTVLRAPLQVGDVLTADDPEPPEGTVVMGDPQDVWLRRNDDTKTGWVLASVHEYTYSWADLTRNRRMVTVLYVPAVSL